MTNFHVIHASHADQASETRLLQALATTMQQLLEALADLLRQRSNRSRLAAELAQCSTRLWQLAQFLPASHGMRQQVSHLHKLLPALIQPQETAVQIRLMVPLWRLQQALPAALPAMAPWRKVGNTHPAALALLAAWWRGQSMPAAMPLQAVARQLAEAARQTTLPPPAVAALLSRWLALQEFERDEPQRQCSAGLLQRVVLVLLMPDVVGASEARRCWQLLSSHAQQQPLPADNAVACDDLVLLQAVQTDLARHRCQVLPFLQQAVAQPGTALLSQPVLMLHYRLPWLLQAAGQHGLARLAHLWQRCLLQHWQLRQPLTPALLGQLETLLQALDMTVWRSLSPLQIASAMLQLLQQWPPANTAFVASVPLSTGNTAAPVPLAGVPDLLAQSFTLLNRVREDWFSNAAMFVQQAPLLAAELHLLEQGAAAVKVQAVERFCSLLLALQHKAGQPRNAQEFPAQLLWRGHCHLIELLDEAAAWQDPQLDVGLVAELQAWQQQGVHEPLPAWCCAGTLAAMTTADLTKRLLLFVDKLAQTLEHPLRLAIVINPTVPATLLPLCETSLQPLLRFLAVEQLQETTLRRQAHQPMAIALELRLDLTDVGVAVELRAAGCTRAPDHQALKRLRHKLPPAVQRLLWRTLPGSGRSLHCTIGE